VERPPARSAWRYSRPTSNYKVVKQFVDKVKERALGVEVIGKASPRFSSS